METWGWAIVLKPLFLLVLFGVIVLPIEMLLYRFFPESRLKVILFDRTFQERRPWTYGLVWLILMALLWGYIFYATPSFSA